MDSRDAIIAGLITAVAVFCVGGSLGYLVYSSTILTR